MSLKFEANSGSLKPYLRGFSVILLPILGLARSDHYASRISPYLLDLQQTRRIPCKDLLDMFVGHVEVETVTQLILQITDGKAAGEPA